MATSDETLRDDERQRPPLTASGRRTVVVVCIAVWAGAMYGGSGLLSNAEGLGVRQAWLRGSPFPDYTIPGLFLLIVIGGGMLLTAVSAALGLPRTRRLALAMSAILLGWGIVETAVIGYRGGPQLVLLGLFVVLPAVLLIRCARRGRQPA